MILRERDDCDGAPRIPDAMQDEPARGRRRPGLPPRRPAQQSTHVGLTEPTATDVEERADQGAHHAAQEAAAREPQLDAGAPLVQLGAEELEPPAALKERLDTLVGEAPDPSAGAPPASESAPEASTTLPSAAAPSRRISKPVLLALGFALASLALALLRS